MEPTDARNVHNLVIEAQWRQKGWEQWLFISSDWHFDNPHCKRSLLFEHLTQAVEKDAPIFCFGDILCLMQGKYDPRKSKVDIRPEHNTANYLDVVCSDSANVLKPWASHLALFGYGNHETSIMKRQETDPLGRMAYILKHEHDANHLHMGGYGGWVRVVLRNEHGMSYTIPIKYYHGSGGGGPVTKGVIQTNRRSVFLPDARLICTGHVHEKWAIELERERLSKHGKISIDKQIHMCTATYKEEYDDGYMGWHVERGASPKPLGGYWVKLSSKRKTYGANSKEDIEINIQYINAV